MSTAKANGFAVLLGALSVPRVGIWRADLELDGDDASKVSGAVELVIGEATWKGKALESGAFVGRVKVRMVGGAGGFATPVEAKFYHAIPARTVIEDLLKVGGEKLSATSDASKLGTILPFWTRNLGTVGEALENVVDELGATWRMLPDGTVWVGVDSYPAANVKDVAVESESPQESKIVFSSESPSLLPGTTFQERKVSRVEHSIESGKTRTTAWFETGKAGTGDAFRAAIEGLVRQATKHFDFYATRAGKVVSQNGDGTLEIKPDDAELPGMSKIPIAYGVPGIKAKVKPGAKVHILFAEGSPKNPRAVVIDPAEVIEIQISTEMLKVAGASDFVALAAKVDDGFAQHKSELDKLRSELAAHTHGSPWGPTTPPLGPFAPGKPVASVKCTKLKTD